MKLLVYVFLLFSGTAEMIILMLAFREALSRRVAVVWVALAVGLAIGIPVVNTFLPLIFNIMLSTITITLVNAWMSARLLNTNWCLTLPLVVFLNALTRLITGIMGALTTPVVNLVRLKTDRPLFGLNPSIIFLNNLSLILIGWLLIIAIGLFAHHLAVRTAVSKFIQHVSIDRQDYWLVLFCYGSYLFATVISQSFGFNARLYMMSASCILFGIISFYLVSSKNDHLTDAQLLDAVTKYNVLLSHRNQQLHLFKHDYQNILLSLSQYIQENDMVGLKAYFEHEVLPNGQNLTVDAAPDQLRHLNVPALSGLIYSKYEAANQRHVDLQLVLLQPLTLPQGGQISVVRVLGNLLDNAIDAATQTDHQVQLAIEVTPQSITFNVLNRIPTNQAVDLRQITKSRFTTKSGHRGFGLSSIEQLANKQLSVRYQVDQQTFHATLILQR